MLLRAALIALAILPLAAACDTVRVHNSNIEAGLLVDGRSPTAGAVNDRARVRSGTGAHRIDVGGLDTNVGGRNEAIAFGNMRAPQRIATPWTSGRDRFDLTLAGPIDLAVTIWIVQGPFSTQRTAALLGCLHTVSTWFYENAGLRITDCTIRDATANAAVAPGAATANALLNSTGGDNRNWDDFSTLIGFDRGRINVYYINQVDGSPNWGWSDYFTTSSQRMGRIVMGRDTGMDLLVHEIGHGMSLWHTLACNDAPNATWNLENVMAQCSAERTYLTEGQNFRMHFDPTSALNAVYGARPGQPTEACGQTLTAACPARERRLWNDGVLLKN